ncbi:EAL domain-containing protein [Bacillus sp. HMF5848]|uniref:bifunctional diguanylate cyclase/phosphodiesterase n=1 Tax=Bacillus sp. HMF5848 TaxID=2495421 RepID=UPI000F7B997B|nr:EAL domain-containing protein [Bacillus sp. HMF5848]RSK28318.1 EAL domain-containing protein [Bacillus sp. HMF5848]
MVKFNKHQSLILIIFIVVIALEVVDLARAFRNSMYVTSFIHVSIILGTFVMLVLLLRANDSTEKELRKSNQKLNNIFDSLDVAIWSHDLKTGELLITPGIQKLYGYSFDEFYKDLTLWKQVIHPDDVSVLKDREQVVNAGLPCTSVYRIIRRDGNIRWIQDRGIPTLDTQGQMVYFTSVLFDITERKESEDRYRSLVEMSPDIIAVISNETIDYINEGGSKLFGANNPTELINTNISIFASRKDIEIVRGKLRGGINDADLNHYELTINRLDGKLVDLEVSIMPIMYEGRSAVQLVGRDITSRKKTEKIIHEMAYYDGLTGAPNRNMFRQHLKNAFLKVPNASFAILFLDLDRFKVINDTKGHTIGDALLKQVATRLKNIVQHKGVVYRQGGDEFIILLEDINKEDVRKISNRIIQNFTSPVVLDGHEFFVTASIGISMYPIDGDNQERLLMRADAAMYIAKEKGKNNYQFYNSELDEVTTKKMELENGLRRAIELDQLTLNYQPKIHLETGEILGVEALIRWNHPVLGRISPAEFIPLAEETGLIVPIGKWVLTKACEQSKKWEEEGVGTIPIAVNISVRQIQDDKFVEVVQSILKQVEVDPGRLELEITESIMQNFEKSTIILKQLKKMGIVISIDDFGTGYSSLSILRNLLIDNIKIDKSFVDDIIDQSDNGSIVKAIIEMGHNLNFNIIAEGIETEEQVKFLVKNSCLIGQGYYFSKPLAAEQLEKLLLEKVQASQC